MPYLFQLVLFSLPFKLHNLFFLMLDRKNKLLHKKEDNKKSMISVQMLRNKYRSPKKIKDFTCNCRQAYLTVPGPMYPCRIYAAVVMLVLTFALKCLSCMHSMLSNIWIKGWISNTKYQRSPKLPYCIL